MMLPAAMPSCLLHRKAFRRGAEGRRRENSGRPQLGRRTHRQASHGPTFDYGKARGASNIGGLSDTPSEAADEF